MSDFQGFPDGAGLHLDLPVGFFSTYLPGVSDVHELKLILTLIFLNSLEPEHPLVFSGKDCLDAESLLTVFSQDQVKLQGALAASAQHGCLLQVNGTIDTYYVLNTPKGRLLIERVKNGELSLDDIPFKGIPSIPTKPNIFKLYEENIGPITPLVAELIIDDEKNYPPAWIKEAIQIAVSRNKRNWHYVRAILAKWREEGKDAKNKRDSQRNGDQYREKWLGKNG